MTRPDRPEGRPAGVGTHLDRTPTLRQDEPISGTYLRVNGDHETMASELIERIGPTAALILAAELLLQADGVIR